MIQTQRRRPLQMALLVQAEIDVNPEGAPIDLDDASDAISVLKPLTQRGSGINLRRAPLTLPRMRKILLRLGLTIAQHDVWCGYNRRQWIEHNRSWDERRWAFLVAENIDGIRAAA